MKTKMGILYGFLIGSVAPLLIVGIVFLIFMIDGKDISSDIIQEDVLESVILLGCGINVGIMLLFFSRSLDFVARGVVISTFVYFIYWVLQFV